MAESVNLSMTLPTIARDERVNALVAVQCTEACSALARPIILCLFKPIFLKLFRPRPGLPSTFKDVCPNCG